MAKNRSRADEEITAVPEANISTDIMQQPIRNRINRESEYSATEFAKAAQAQFGVPSEVVVAAFKAVNRDGATLSEAKSIVKKFLNKEVK